MKLFITGATGFIGSYLLKIALRDGFHITAITRSLTKNNLIKHDNLKWIKKDLLSIKKKDLEGNDVLINLASVGVSPREVPFEELIKVNIKGASNLMENSIKANIKRTIFIGTCHEYGLSANHYEFIPEDAPLRPLTAYASSKVAAFNLISSLCRENNIQFVYQRIFSAFGVGQNSTNLWPSLREAALAGKDFMMTEGSQIRDFIPVEDVANHILNACTRNDVRNGIPFVMNVGSGKALSIYEFAMKEWKKFNAKGKIKKDMINQRSNELYCLRPKLTNLLPPKPKNV
tara:strand:- start:1886 stop:2749 length:864 start_codon:yes stop_codon:yes gene_type:complete